MLKQKPEFKRVLLTVCLTVNILILLGLLTSVGAVEYATYYPSAYNVVNGTYLSGSLPSSLQNIDSDYFTVASSPSATSASMHNSSGYNLSSGTYVSGTAEDLYSNDDTYQVYRSLSSATSPQSLYAHQEATTIGGNPYSFQKLGSADSAGISLSAPMYPTGRNLLGKFIYPLNGISSIPASTWTQFYRAWRDPDQSIEYDSTGSGNNGGGTPNIVWSHVVGSGFNRFMVIGISISTVTVSVSSVTVGAQSATFLRNDTRGTVARGEVWYLVNPNSGPQTISVTLSDVSKATGGSVSYAGVDQINPIDNHSANVTAGFNPSIALTTTTANNWIFSNLAISGTYTVTVHGAGQTHRYYEIGSGGNRVGDDGDDKVAIVAGPHTMSWTMSFSAEVVAQAVAIRPAPPPVGHVDVDISILKSDGTIRTSIVANAASSIDLTPTPTTLSGAYNWAAYPVVGQTDFLEIDYYVDVASGIFGVSAYLRIDDISLPLDDQTRTIDVMLPSEQTVEVELTGTCNTYNWTQLQWAIDSAWTTGSAVVTMQLYNYTLGAYPASGNGFVLYTSNATANTDEERMQIIAANPQNFRNATGNWKVKVKGVKTISAPFDFKADWVEFRPTYHSEYTVSTEFQFSSMTTTTPMQLNFSLVNEYDVAGASVTIQVWNYSSSEYVTGGQGYLRYTSLSSNETQRVSIDVNPLFYVSNGDAKIRVTALLSTPMQYQQETNQASLVYVVAGVIQPFDWPLMLLYVVPVAFALLLVWFIVSRRRKRTSFTGKRTDLFSGQFGMNHQQMTGRKILLEIDPDSDYNLAFSSFVSEAKNNGESLVILTNEDSALHSVFSGDAKVNFLLLSSKTDSPQQVNERVTLLPADDLSGILDTFNRIQQATGEENISLLFDNVSDVIAKCGFDETYEFTRSLLEAISSSKTTAVFAFLPGEHGQEVSSSIRGLFQDHLAYSNDGARTGNL
jgi:hypothetical protein